MLNNAWEEMVIDAKVRLLDSVEELYNKDDNIDWDDIFEKVFYHGFNEDHEWCYNNECREVCNALDVWDCIALVRNYEVCDFGEVTTDVHSPFHVANMVWVIVGYMTYNSIPYEESYSHDELKDAIKEIDVKRVLNEIEWYINIY